VYLSGFLNLLQLLSDALRIEAVGRIRVRRGYQVGGAVLCRHAHHGERILKRTGAVIQPVQHVAVNVDQITILAPTRTPLTTMSRWDIVFPRSF
jgi:hypothetical protein